MAPAPDSQNPQKSGPLSPGVVRSATGEIDPAAVLSDGAMRAKNIAHALGMIAVLLARYVFVKQGLDRLKALKSRWVMLVARVFKALLLIANPYIGRMKAQAASTRNQVLRAALLAAIAAVAPIEDAATKAIKTAKVEGARLTAAGARRTVLALKPIVVAFVVVISSGFQKAAVQRLVARLVSVLEEAER